MNECKKCNVRMDNQRIHLGYTECLDCSEVEAYSAHQVYPHKTGGYVQPVSSHKKKHLDSIDRRSRSGSRTAKGIYADNSWDRWLEKYWHDLYNPKPKSDFKPKKVLFNHQSITKVLPMIMGEYWKFGYDRAIELTNTYYKRDKITLNTKCTIVSQLTALQSLNSKQRKIIKKNT